MGDGGVSGAGGSTRQQDDERWRIAEQQRTSTVPAPATSTAATALKIGGIYVPPFSPETIARLQAPPVLGNLAAYDDPLLDREITAARARLASSSGTPRAADELNLEALEQEQTRRRAAADKQRDAARVPPLLADVSGYSVDKLEQELETTNAKLAANPTDESERAGLDRLQKELAKRLTPEPVDIDFLKTDSQVLDALKKETSFLSRFKNDLSSEVRLRHEATLNELEEKHNALYADAHACDNAKVPTAALPGGANGSYELQVTADDLVNALKQRMPITAREEAAVRSQFESWRNNQCRTTGEDPTRIRNEAAQHFEKDTTTARRAEMQKRAEMLQASTGSVCAALAFVDSAMRGDSVDAAYARVMGAGALSDVTTTVIRGPQAHFDTTETTGHSVVQAQKARPAVPSAAVRAKPPAPAANTASVTVAPKVVEAKPAAVPAAPSTPAAPPVPVAASPAGAAGTSAVGRVEPFSSPSGTFRTKPMNAGYEREDVPGNTVWTNQRVVKYLRTNAERAPYKLEVRKVIENGKTELRIFGADGKPFDTRSAATVMGGAGKAIFVMNADGELFASTYQKAGSFHHSSLAGGQPIAAAGELVVENGKLIEVTNQSGHYWPDASFTNQALASLQNKGVNLSGVKVRDVRSGTERVFQ